MAARVESRFTVPASTTLSVSSGALTSPVTVTWPAASYFHSAAGGVSSGLTALTSAINAAVQGYPDNASSMASAIGYGTWTAGWSLNGSSSPLTASFGAPSLTSVSSPIIGNTGPRGGVDKSVAFDSDADALTGGNVHDVIATDDLVIATVIYPYTTTGNDDILGKGFVGGAGAGYYLDREGTVLALYVCDGVDTQVTSVTIAASDWYGVIAALDRSSNLIRLGVVNLSTGVVAVSSTANTASVGTLSNANSFNLGDNGTNRAFSGEVAALYVGTGTGAASGLVTNLSTALTNFYNAVNSSFSVSMSTSTGLVTLSNSFWPCAITMDDDTQSLLGFAYDFDYPQTAAQMATALGYGTWTNGVGWLCNESSGNLASIFGSVTLTATGAPSYSNIGARGGSDKAVGFTVGTDRFDGGTSVGNLTASDDLILVLVANTATTPVGSVDSLATKYNGANGGWQLNLDTSGNVYFQGFDTGGAGLFLITVANQLKTWCVIIAVVDRSTGKARLAIYPLNGSGPTVSAESTVAASSMSNAVAFRVGDRADNPGIAPLDTKIAAVFGAAGAGVATGLSANLSTALSNFAAYMKSQTGTQQAKGVWFPGCPLNLDSDPAVAPKVTDRRSTQSPTGQVLSLVGNYSLRHKGVRWEAVARSQIWESAATYTNGSFETFADDCLYGLGHAWFTPSSPLSIWWNDAGTDRALGYTHNSSTGVPGWYVIDVTSTEPKQVTQGWTGLWRVDFGDVVGVGS